MMEKYIAPPLFMLAMKGVWGFLLAGLLFLPLVSFVIPGNDNDHIEDFEDALYMIADNKMILWTFIVHLVGILFINWASMIVTKETTSVIRSLFDVIKSSCIWATNLLIGEVFFKNSVYGERWSTFSWI